MKTIIIDGIEYKLKEITNQKPKEKRFAELISGIDINKPITDFEEYPNTLFWFDKDGNYIAEYDFENKEFWPSYYKIWSVLKEEFGLDHVETQAFTQIEVEKHFKLNGVTTAYFSWADETEVEKHFKLKGVITAE